MKNFLLLVKVGFSSESAARIKLLERAGRDNAMNVAPRFQRLIEQVVMVTNNLM